jgi:sporulation protein YlmC with PRC-barrel domain
MKNRTYQHGPGERRLCRLGDLHDFKVVEGQPDVTGWKVYASDGTRIGLVQELIVDASSWKVRYLDVKLEEEIARDMGGDNRLVPIAMANVNEEDKIIFLEGVRRAALRSLPDYKGESFSRSYPTG